MAMVIIATGTAAMVAGMNSSTTVSGRAGRKPCRAVPTFSPPAVNSVVMVMMGVMPAARDGFVQRQQAVVGIGRRDLRLIERDPPPVAAALLAGAGARRVDHDLAHHGGADRKEMGAVAKVDMTLPESTRRKYTSLTKAVACMLLPGAMECRRRRAIACRSV